MDEERIAMMGQLDSGQDKLFYSFNIDNHVPRTHLLRGVDRALDLADLRQHLMPFYSPIGRPSIDPELMIRMLIVGYCFGIRSERRPCEEVHLNLAYRRFCDLGLDDVVPEHSTFSVAIDSNGVRDAGIRLCRLVGMPCGYALWEGWLNVYIDTLIFAVERDF
jgi:transposase